MNKKGTFRELKNHTKWQYFIGLRKKYISELSGGLKYDFLDTGWEADRAYGKKGSEP